jgi:two-component system alkaline phosphatase synthesis response regulator PhoP
MNTVMNEKSVLIVEDDRDLRDAYVIILKSEGYDIKAAENGRVALDLIKEQGDPGIIFLDLRMPVMNGIEFLEEYKPQTHPKTEIIVFSNFDGKTEIDAAYELGAQRYVLKARAAPKELIRIVKSIIS